MKLIYKLSILGVLGDNPMEFLNGNDNDDYIYDMFDTFKRRLISSDDNDDDNGDSNSRDESKIGDGSDSGDVQLMLVDAFEETTRMTAIITNYRNRYLVMGITKLEKLNLINWWYRNIKSILVCP